VPTTRWSERMMKIIAVRREGFAHMKNCQRSSSAVLRDASLGYSRIKLREAAIRDHGDRELLAGALVRTTEIQ
jgi:hypothetical protein